jgi:hypothetical protein
MTPAGNSYIIIPTGNTDPGNVQGGIYYSTALGKNRYYDASGWHDLSASVAPKLDDCLAPDDNTDLNALTTKHGLLPKLGGGTTNFLRADGTWAAPPMPAAPTAHGFTKSAELGAGSVRILNMPYGGQAYAMIITVVVSSSLAGSQMLILSDSSNPPTTNIYTSPGCTAWGPMGFTFVVPQGHYYKVDINGGGYECVVSWYEYRITT